jgi:hypothetical protein
MAQNVMLLAMCSTSTDMSTVGSASAGLEDSTASLAVGDPASSDERFLAFVSLSRGPSFKQSRSLSFEVIFRKRQLMTALLKVTSSIDRW